MSNDTDEPTEEEIKIAEIAAEALNTACKLAHEAGLQECHVVSTMVTGGMIMMASNGHMRCSMEAVKKGLALSAAITIELHNTEGQTCH